MAMGPRPQPANPQPAPLPKTDQIDHSLMERLEHDGRIESGITAGQRLNDIDFIQMTGLTQPPMPPEKPFEAPGRDTDPTKPVDFYEPGVSDVDGDVSMDPERQGSEPDANIVDRLDIESPVAALKNIIAELSDVQTPLSPSKPVEQAVEKFPEPVTLVESVEPAKRVPEQQAPILDESVLRMLQAIQAEKSATAEPTLSRLPMEPEVSIPAPLPSKLELPEAQAILDELEAQPRESSTLPAVDDDVLGPIAYRIDLEEGETASHVLDDAVVDNKLVAPITEHADPGNIEAARSAVYNKPEPHASQRRRHRDPRRRVRRRLIAWTVRIILVAGLGFGAYKGYEYWQARMAAPDALFVEAQRSYDAQDYETAAEQFQLFAARNSEHTLRPEAQFLEGTALELSAQSSTSGTHDVLVRARNTLIRFIDENPNHEKVHRARNLVGSLHFQLGEYKECVNVLRGSNLGMQDPIATLPAIRLLARAHAKLGDSESAESAYRQAISMNLNFNKDDDYDELGDLYKSLADKAKDPLEKDNYQKLAVAQWNKAANVKGVNPAQRKELLLQPDQLRSEMQGVIPSEGNQTPSEASAAHSKTPETASAPSHGDTATPTEHAAPAVDSTVHDVPSEVPPADASATTSHEAAAASTTEDVKAESVPALDASPENPAAKDHAKPASESKAPDTHETVGVNPPHAGEAPEAASKIVPLDAGKPEAKNHSNVAQPHGSKPEAAAPKSETAKPVETPKAASEGHAESIASTGTVKKTLPAAGKTEKPAAPAKKSQPAAQPDASAHETAKEAPVASATHESKVAAPDGEEPELPYTGADESTDAVETHAPTKVPVQAPAGVPIKKPDAKPKAGVRHD
jgi:tetratricopeptide (TPR) repeat protein